MRFDLFDLRLFLHVAEAASITRGAARSHIALAAASTRIRRMEEALATPLLERGRRGVRLTAAGEAFLHHARIVLHQLEHMRGDLAAYARGLKGRVRVLSNTAALADFLPERLAAFLKAHPRIDVDVEERPSQRIVQALAEGTAEIGVVADTIDLGALEAFFLREDPLVVVMPEGHAFAARRRIAFRELLGEDLVGLSEGSAFQDHLAQHAAQAGRHLRFRIRLGSFEAVCRMVADGVGLAVMPRAAASRCAAATALERVPLGDAWARRRLFLCVRRLGELPPHARQLVDFLKS